MLPDNYHQHQQNKLHFQPKLYKYGYNEPISCGKSQQILCHCLPIFWNNPVKPLFQKKTIKINNL